ncbi:MAG: hypothetical protein IJ146_13755, partial [Kiritimatiellae bacterium]|nr:hypothetical protein [Kiritimatiellia bacterium]
CWTLSTVIAAAFAPQATVAMPIIISSFFTFEHLSFLNLLTKDVRRVARMCQSLTPLRIGVHTPCCKSILAKPNN